MYRSLVLFIIAIIYVVNNRRIDRKSENFIYISKLCQYFPKYNVNGNVTFVCPVSSDSNEDKNIVTYNKNELLVNFNKYYTYDKNNKLVDKVLLSNTLDGNSSTLSICNQPGSKDCKILNLYLVNPRNPDQINIDQSTSLNSQKESSLVYDIDLINKNILTKEYDPYKNVFQVTLNKDNKGDRDIILKLNNNNNLVYELNGVRLKDVKIHSLEVLNNNRRLNDRNRRDFVLISHNTISNKRSFLVIRLKYISMSEIHKGKLVSIRLSNNLPKDLEDKNNLANTSTFSHAGSNVNKDTTSSNTNNKQVPSSSKDKDGVKGVELVIMEDDQESEKVVEIDEDRMLLDLNVHNDNEIYVNGVEIQDDDYKFLITGPSTYTIKHKNKTHKLVFKRSKDHKQRKYRFIQAMWIVTIVNVFYSLYKFYFESLNYIIFLVLFSDHLNGGGSENAGTFGGMLIRYLLVYVDDGSGNLNINVTKSFLLLIVLYFVAFVIVFLYCVFLLLSTSTNSVLVKRIKKLRRYKMNALILLNYLMLLMVIVYIKIYKYVKYVYARGFKINSLSFNLLTLVVILIMVLTIYHLYPKSLRKAESENNKKFKLSDLVNNDDCNTLSNAGSSEYGYKQKLITKPSDPKDRNVIIIDRKYQILYINSIISETMVIIFFYLTSRNNDKETGIFMIKFLYWFIISVYIQRNCGYYNQDKFNRYLLTKSLRYLAVTTLVMIQMFVKREIMAYLIFIYVNHCINHKIVYNIIKLAKKYKYVVSS